MHRLVPLFVLPFVGCGIFTISTPESKQADAAPPTTEAAAAPAEASFGLDSVRAFAKRSAAEDLDCPMSQEDAGKMRKLGSSGDAGELAARIGCACWIEYTCEGPRRLSADQCYLRESLDDYARKQELGEDAELVAWGQRLQAKQKATVEQLSRSEPILSEKPPVTDEEVRATALFGALQDGLNNMKENVRMKTWFLVPRYHATFLANYDSLKKNILCGGSNAAADALHAEAAELMAVAGPKAKAWARAEKAADNDPRYRALRKRADGMSAKAKRKAHNAHIANGDYQRFCSNNSGDQSDMCRLRDDESNVRSEMDQIFEKYLKKYGYYDEPKPAGPR